MEPLRIDPEFESLIPPLSDDEFKQLEENIVEAGMVYDPIITWDGVIIDGHNRWKIIQKHPEVSYKTYMEIFSDRNEAKLWIINNQLGRRNLNKADAIILAQKKSEVTAQAAKEKQISTLKQNENRSIKNDKTETAPIHTQKETAKLAGVSVGTVAQFEQIQKKKPELIEPIRKGELTIGGAYKAMKDEERTPEPPKPVEPPKPIEYTINDLVKVVSALEFTEEEMKLIQEADQTLDKRRGPKIRNKVHPVKEFRARHNLTQAQLAEMMWMSKGAIEDIERGKSAVSDYVLRWMAAYDEEG